MSDAQNAPQPGETDPKIFKQGTPVFMVASPRSQTIEDWVQLIARETGLRMDWRLVGGRGIVLVLGDRGEAQRGQHACTEALERLRAMYMACTYNFTTDPKPSDVVSMPLAI